MRSPTASACEVEPAVEEGPRCEFTRPGVPASGVDEPADEFGLDEGGAVDGDFHGVLAGEGAGRSNTVARHSSRTSSPRAILPNDALWLPRLSSHERTGRWRSDGLRSRDANDRDAAHSGRRRNRADGFPSIAPTIPRFMARNSTKSRREQQPIPMSVLVNKHSKIIVQGFTGEKAPSTLAR